YPCGESLSHVRSFDRTSRTCSRSVDFCGLWFTVRFQETFLWFEQVLLWSDQQAPAIADRRHRERRAGVTPCAHSDRSALGSAARRRRLSGVWAACLALLALPILPSPDRPLTGDRHHARLESVPRSMCSSDHP